MIIFANNFQEVNWNENLYKKLNFLFLALTFFSVSHDGESSSPSSHTMIVILTFYTVTMRPLL